MQAHCVMHQGDTTMTSLFHFQMNDSNGRLNNLCESNALLKTFDISSGMTGGATQFEFQGNFSWAKFEDCKLRAIKFDRLQLKRISQFEMQCICGAFGEKKEDEQQLRIGSLQFTQSSRLNGPIHKIGNAVMFHILSNECISSSTTMQTALIEYVCYASTLSNSPNATAVKSINGPNAQQE